MNPLTIKIRHNPAMVLSDSFKCENILELTEERTFSYNMGNIYEVIQMFQLINNCPHIMSINDIPWYEFNELLNSPISQLREMAKIEARKIQSAQDIDTKVSKLVNNLIAVDNKVSELIEKTQSKKTLVKQPKLSQQAITA